MKNHLIVLDPGHGGINSKGVYTTAPNKQFYFEKEGEWAFEGVLNRHIAEEVKDALAYEGYKNVLFTVTPNDPRDISLASRVKISNKMETDLFVSIHCNASANHTATGFEIFTSPGITNSDKAVLSILSSVIPLLKKYDIRNRGHKQERFYVLGKTKAPAVLIECGFFDNWGDYEMLKSPIYQRELGKAIACGIIDYLER